MQHADWNALLCGSLSGSLTQITLHPLDSIKVRIQAMGRGQVVHKSSIQYLKQLPHIHWSSLYQGASPAIIASAISWGLYFFIYNSSKKYYASHEPWALILSSFQAGFTTSFITHPIWLIKTRMQLQSKQSMYKGTWHGLRTIFKEEGFSSLFIGIGPSLALISHGMIHFVLYDMMKQMWLTRQDKKELSGWESFGLSAFSKTAAALTTYPFQVVKTRLQDQRNLYDQIQYKGMFDCISKMYKMEGLSSFYRGILAHAIRVAPQGAVAMVWYEQLSKLFTLNESLAK